MVTKDFNALYAENGWPISNICEQCGMIDGLLKNATFDPYARHNWALAGFTMYADEPTAESPSLEFL